MKRLAVPFRLAAMAAIFLLCACGGRNDPNSLEPEGGYVLDNADPRPLVARVTSLETSNTPGGIIVRAFGDPPTQGYWDPDLVDVTPVGAGIDTITLEFRAAPPVDREPTGTPESRRIDAAAFLSTAEMRGKTRIEVVGASGASVLRR